MSPASIKLLIDEIDELFQNNRRIASRRPSFASQMEAAESGRIAEGKPDSNEALLDTVPLRNPEKERQLTAATVTPPLRCADNPARHRLRRPAPRAGAGAPELCVRHPRRRAFLGLCVFIPQGAAAHLGE